MINQLLIDRVRTSRALGANKSLVLHGGGNTSVKITEKNIFGEEEEILYEYLIYSLHLIGYNMH